MLVNNAGVMATPEMRTPEGWELQFATNHLGHFALRHRTVRVARGLARPGPHIPAGDALVFADNVALLLEGQDDAGKTPSAGIVPGGQPADLALHRTKIDQATGMLTEQLGTGIAGCIHTIAGLRLG
jgi:hypothetical protein